MEHQLYIRELLLAAPWDNDGEHEENSTNDCSHSQREELESESEWEDEEEVTVYEDFEEEGEG
jgi:hypothetical protein